MMMTRRPMGAIEAPELDDTIKRLLDGGKRGAKQVQLSESEIRQLCIEAKRVFLSQPNLLEVHAPIKICGLGKLFWAEAVAYGSHLINRRKMTAIGDRAPVDVWSGKSGKDSGVLREFGCPVYFSVKGDTVNPQAKKFLFIGFKRNLNGYRLWDPENRKIVLCRYVTFGEASGMGPTISGQVEITRTKRISQRVEVDATPSSSGVLASVGITSEVTPSVDRVASGDAKQVRGFAARRARQNPHG